MIYINYLFPRKVIWPCWHRWQVRGLLTPVVRSTNFFCGEHGHRWGPLLQVLRTLRRNCPLITNFLAISLWDSENWAWVFSYLISTFYILYETINTCKCWFPKNSQVTWTCGTFSFTAVIFQINGYTISMIWLNWQGHTAWRKIHWDSLSFWYINNSKG